MANYKLQTEFGDLFDKLEDLIDVERPTQDHLNQWVYIVHQEPKVKAAFETAAENWDEVPKADGLPDAWHVYWAFKGLCIKALLVFGERLAVDVTALVTKHEAEWKLEQPETLPIEIEAPASTVWRKLWHEAEKNDPTSRHYVVVNDEIGRTKTDKKTDKIEPTKKYLRPLTDEARECIRIYKSRRRKEKTLKMSTVVNEYVEDNGGSPESIKKSLRDNKDQWTDK